LRERKNGVAIIEVASTIKPNPQAKPTEMGSPGMTSSSEFSGNQKGIIEIQESTGLIIKSKITQQMSGQNTITRPGVPDKVTPMEIKGVISMETSDWDKAKSIVGINAVAERQPRRETPYAQPERPQRRVSTYAKSAAQPYPIDDEEEYEEYVPVRPRQRKPSESIHQAVVDGDIDQVQQLLSQGVDINSRNRMGRSPLHEASYAGRSDVAELLIAKGADIEAKGKLEGSTPLHVAAQKGRKNVAELLLAKGADINAKDKWDGTPLHAAALVGHKDVAEFLIANGADIEAKGDGRTPLKIAKARGHTEIVELLLKHGAIDRAVARTEDRISRLQARQESPQRRASTYAQSAAQPYPIDDEEEYEEEYVPVQPRQRKPSESIHQAVVDGDIDQVQQLLSQGVDINSRNRMGWSLLRTAIQNRQQAVVELLIAKGADVNAKDNSGQTPLLVAVNTGQKDVVELLITKGADVNIMGGRGDNALSLAKKGRLPNHPEIVELLLKHGAEEPSLEDMMGDRYEEEGLYPGYEEERMAQRPTRTFSPIVQAPVYVDILADPNEIKARIKTFEGLEKALAEVAGKSQSETRQWQQNRYDNRTLLIRTVEKQFEDEIGFVRKVAVEEKAKKTTAAIDSLLSRRKERLKKVSRELLEQKRAQRQTQAPTRGRSRYSGRSTRGRYPQSRQLPGGGMEEPYAERYDTMPGTSRYQEARRPPEPVDRETENEIRLWVQSTIDKRAELAKGVHEQIRIDISPIRNVAVEEEAKKTTAAIDGLLLYRQMRFDEFIKKTEEEQRALQQTQDPRIRGRGRYPQDGPMQQQNQPRPRRRRR